MIIVEYPVALVLKLWHVLFTKVFGIAPSVAWIVAVIFLVLTVRSLLAPLTLRQIRSSRNLANLRPQLHKLSQEYAGRTDAESRQELNKRRKQMQLEGGYRMRDGCLPALIQIPVFIGLYRMLLRVARPNGVVDPNNLQGFGPLSDEDVYTFMHARIFGVPLITYVQMPEQSLANLGTDQASVLRVALPMVLLASTFTATNLIFSIRRTKATMDPDQGFSYFALGLLKVMLPIVFFMPILFGLLGPLPVMVFVYWLTNNLCTLTITQGIHLWSDKTHPYTEEFHAHNEMQLQRRMERKEEKRVAKRQKRRTGRHRR